LLSGVESVVLSFSQDADRKRTATIRALAILFIRTYFAGNQKILGGAQKEIRGFN
jgi:hypothetical protein